jgi:hypothetical protein
MLTVQVGLDAAPEVVAADLEAGYRHDLAAERRT